MQATYIVVFLVYCVVVFLIGIWAKQKVGNMEQYLVADRDLGIFATGLAYYSTAQSSGAFLGTVGWAYTYGWASSNYVSIPIALGAILTWGLLSKRVHKIVGDMKGMTIPDLLEFRFPKKSIRLVSLIIIIIAYIPMMVANVKGCGTLVQSVFDVSFPVAALIGLAIVSLYVMMGGMKAVAYTDVFQGFLMIASVVTLVVASLAAVGGFTEMNVQAEALSPGITSVWGVADSWGPTMALSMTLTYILSPLGQPIYITKFFAMKDRNVARFAMPISYTCVLIASFSFPVIGLCAKVLFPNLENADSAFTTMVTNVLPPVVGAIVLVSLFAAVMSTIDAMLLAVTGAVVRDFYNQYLGKTPSPAFLKRASVICTIAIAAICYVLALESPAAIMTVNTMSVGLLGASFVVVMVGGIYTKKLNAQGALAAMLGGFLGTVLTTEGLFIDKALLGMNAFVWGFLCSIIAAVVVTNLTKKPQIQAS